MRLLKHSYLIFLSVFLFSCSGGGEAEEELIAVGGKQYGGEFKFMSSEHITSLLPTYAADLYSMRMLSQLYQPLLTLDDELEVKPNVAESYTVSNDGRVYTFKIRKGIFFHKNDCFGDEKHELDADDVKFTLDMACSAYDKNQIDYLLVHRIKGADDHYKKSKNKHIAGGVSGIKVVDKNTVTITLTHPFAGFDKILTHYSLGIYPKEAFEKYGAKIGENPVGTGPFALESISDDKIVLKRNPDFWQKDEFGNKLPFLSKVVMTYTKDKKSELKAFRNGKTDLVLEIPVEEINDIFGTLEEAKTNIKHKVDSEKSISMNYIAMAIESEEFGNADVRKAFNLAINREDIIESWLEGEGWVANNGFVPSMKNYPAEKVKGHDFDAEKAQSLMKKAGYSNGNGFPELDFYVNTKEGSTVHKMCKAIASQVKENINVTLNIKLCSYEERQNAILSGKAKIWRTGWVADYPDPENFLAMFYGGNIHEHDEGGMMNTFRYKNEAYDLLFEKAIAESDAEKRTDLLTKCDQMVVDEAIVMPVFTDDHIVIINARVRNFAASPMESLRLSHVFIKEFKKKE